MPRLIYPAAFLLGVSSLTGDLITLKSGDSFKGKILALSDGMIALQSPHSEAPLRVYDANLQQLEFDETSDDVLPKDSQVINLRNGDTFPGRLMGLSDTHLSFQTWFAGQLEVPRAQVESLFFGVTPQTTLYRGPQSLTEWEEGNKDVWEFDEDQLLSGNRGTIGKDFNLPENFIFSTRFTWGNSPNFRIYFCTDQVHKINDAGFNCYQLSVTTQGVEVRRVNAQAEGRNKYKLLTTYREQLRDHEAQSIEIEVRIDRSSGMVKLTIDGDEMIPGYDPDVPPGGSHIVFESLSSTRRDSQVSEIHLQEWDTKTQRFREEARTDEKTDTLTVDDGDRFSGEIVSYDPASEEQHFVVKSPQSTEPISIPLKNCSVMFFTRPDAPSESSGDYRADLHSGGELTLSKIKLGDEFLEAEHPWLGPLTLDRRIINSISKGQTPAQ